MRILYISPVPYEGAGCRFRIYQYIPYLSEKGIECIVSPFLFKRFFKTVYKKGRILIKISFFIRSCVRRAFDLVRALRYDCIIIYREALPFGPPLFEKTLHLFGKKIIFDFDDAIFLPTASDANRIIMHLRPSNNCQKIIKMSTMVFAGNHYLMDYAAQFNNHVHVMPTIVDTDKFIQPKTSEVKRLVIGWTGTATTQKYLFILQNVFRRLLEKYPGIEFRFIGADSDCLGLSDPRIIYKEWSLKDEIEDLQEFAIGIMPLPDTEWAKGKCAFKVVQYMSLAIPAVASRVGANIQVIQDGINGFLASTDEEWMKKLSSLIEDFGLRRQMGVAGRKLVEEKFSLKVYAPKYYQAIIRAVKNEN